VALVAHRGESDLYLIPSGFAGVMFPRSSTASGEVLRGHNGVTDHFDRLESAEGMAEAARFDCC
jgi:hypothetical protein